MICFTSGLWGAFPIIAEKPKITHEEAYRILSNDVLGEKFEGTYTTKVIPHSIVYTTLEHSKILRNRVNSSKKENRKELEEKLSEWGWLMTIAGYQSLEHSNAYFVTSEGECIWIHTMD
ncbi:hypothetical protein DDZ13_13020 [Coraliomargarita sinensis]|uniref:Uncharacterized protein n=1 Tax=Coraliomargarita sinensis TaxID=2174842 RepID=A0A317ZH84_9BACT|nr:hypothetical protein DDZ13_13020 [Coraliomargarita sinensis]